MPSRTEQQCERLNGQHAAQVFGLRRRDVRLLARFELADEGLRFADAPREFGLREFCGATSGAEVNPFHGQHG